MIQLTVYFEAPFWVGVFENTKKNSLQTSRVVFGSEPKDYEVYEFILQNYYHLNFGKTVVITKESSAKKNPKRMQREISKQLNSKSISTKAQQAIALEHESRKVERKTKSKEQKLQEKQERFTQRQEKKKDKKKGH